MARKEIAQKLIVVESAGPIGELGGISGPVLSPCYVPIEIINRMLNHHRRVYEVNPNNYKEKVPLSLRNLRKQNFAKEATPQPKAHLAPNIYTEPKVRNSNEVMKDFTDDTMTIPLPGPKKKTEAPKVTVTPVAAEEKKEEPISSDFTRND